MRLLLPIFAAVACAVVLTGSPALAADKPSKPTGHRQTVQEIINKRQAVISAYKSRQAAIKQAYLARYGPSQPTVTVTPQILPVGNFSYNPSRGSYPTRSGR